MEPPRHSPICHPVLIAVEQDGEETMLEIELHAGCVFRYALNEKSRAWLSHQLRHPDSVRRVLTTGV
jgi:hypothetical protein